MTDLRPDLIAFVESIKTDDYDQVEDLLGAEFHIYHQADRESDGQAASIASRWPLGVVQEVDLHVTPRSASFASTTIIAEVQAPAPFAPMTFVNHMPSWELDFEYERELQAVAAARAIDEIAGRHDRHVVLAGDFGDANAASQRFWRGHQSLSGYSTCYRDAWDSKHPGEPGETLVPWNPLVFDWDWPFRRVDFIFVRCGEHGGPTLAISSSALVFDEPKKGIWASDHFGVMADLVMPPKDPVPVE